MVTGWSYLVGSNGVPASCISCTSALPREVTRREICPTVPSFISGCGGSTVIGPFHVPARDFSWVKDFCASEGAGWFAEVCISCWASAMVARHSRTKASRNRSFIFILLANLGQCDAVVLLYLTITLNKCQEFFQNIMGMFLHPGRRSDSSNLRTPGIDFREDRFPTSRQSDGRLGFCGGQPPLGEP